jgi:hypothetical protein
MANTTSPIHYIPRTEKRVSGKIVLIVAAAAIALFVVVLRVAH